MQLVCYLLVLLICFLFYPAIPTYMYLFNYFIFLRLRVQLCMRTGVC